MFSMQGADLSFRSVPHANALSEELIWKTSNWDPIRKKAATA